MWKEQHPQRKMMPLMSSKRPVHPTCNTSRRAPFQTSCRILSCDSASAPCLGAGGVAIRFGLVKTKRLARVGRRLDCRLLRGVQRGPHAKSNPDFVWAFKRRRALKILDKDDTRQASRRGDPEATCAVLRTASCETRCHSSHRWAVSQHGKGIVVGAASAQRRQAIGRPDFENTNFGDPEKRRDFEDLLQKQIDMRDYLYKNFW